MSVHSASKFFCADCPFKSVDVWKEVEVLEGLTADYLALGLYFVETETAWVLSRSYIILAFVLLWFW